MMLKLIIRNLLKINRLKFQIHEIFIFLICNCILSVTTAFADTTNVVVVLDASGSMRQQIEGSTKMDIAKDAIRDVIRTLPRNVRLGLRVYGHQSPQYLHDCQDSRLELPLDFVNYQQLVGILKKINPRGYTPLAYSLAQVQDDFIYDGRNVVVCVTDGIETCGGDPCVVADTLSSAFNLVFHVVGFDVGETDREILMCIPENSGGQYFSATNTRELRNAIKDVFELSINPGYLKLGFSGLDDKVEFIYGRLLTGEQQYRR